MKEENEPIRQKIISFWEETGENMEVRNAFLSFLEENGLGKNSMYTYIRGECRKMPPFKLKGLKVCIDEFKKNNKKKRNIRTKKI